MTAALLRLALGLVHAEGALDHVAALLDLAVVLVTELVLGELLAPGVSETPSRSKVFS